MDKEELKNQILTLLKDIFSFGFYYDKETDQFICDYDAYDDCIQIEVDKEGIDFYVSGRDYYRHKTRLDDLTKLTKYLKEFYK